MKYLIGGAFAIVAMVLALNTSTGGEKAKYTIKEVMKNVMANPVNKKLGAGTASDDEKKKVVEYVSALAANTPPKGDADSWKAKSKALVDAAKSGDAKAWAAAANCKACHSVHK